MTSIDDPGHDTVPSSSSSPRGIPDAEDPSIIYTHGLPPDRPLADPSKAPPRFASPRPSPLVRSSYETYFDRGQLLRDITQATLIEPEPGVPHVALHGQTDWYLDLWPIITSPYFLDRVAFALGNLIAHGLPGNPYAHPARRPNRLVGIETWSMLLAIAVSLEIGMPTVMLRKDANLFGPRRYKGRIDDELDEKSLANAMIEGRLDTYDVVVLLAGVVGAGFQLTRGASILQNFGISKQSIYAVSFVDREQGAVQLLAEAGISYTPLFTKTDLWI